MLWSGAAVPTPLPGVVARASLFERLSAHGGWPVTLISAPAGSGKTVLLRSWIAAAGVASRIAWVTVDRGEHDPQRFWLQVVDALRTVADADKLVDRRSPTPEFDGHAFVDRLIVELGGLDDDVVLVIDDLHELTSAGAEGQLERLLARRPPHLRVIFATRHDPAIGLHRLRLSGELGELRGGDLRFTATETSELLDMAGVAVSDEMAVQLQARTEGWAAGLRLAALSLTGHRDPERFVAEFSGSERTVADYLLAEVLESQPQEVRTLLLRTSILDRVSGPLADALLGMTGSERILLALEASNAFVLPVDSERVWFRYHQLFAELLRLELRRTSPEVLPALHRAAAEWYAEHGHVIDAVRHFQAAEDWPGAGRLLAENGISLVLDGLGPTVDALLGAFPAQALGDPELLALLAYRELSERSLQVAAEYLALAERRADAFPPDARRRVDLALALTRLALARRRGDLDAALREVRPFLEPIEARTPRELVLGGDARAIALINLAIVELWSSQLADAQRHLEQALALAREIERPFVEVASLSHIGLLVSRQSFAEGRARCEEALLLADAHGWQTHPIVGTALAAMASMDAAQGRFEDAHGRLERAAPLLRDEIDPAGALLLHFIRGDLLAGEARLAEAIEAYRAAERLQALLATRHLLTGPVRDFTALALIRAGDTAAARAALAELPSDVLAGAEARVASAALHIAEGSPAEAIADLDEVLAETVPVLRVGTMIQAFVLAAAAQNRLGDPTKAEDLIERALDEVLAETVPVLRVGTMIQASVLAAAAQNRLGDATKAEDLIERALDLAEADGLVLQFLVTPAPQLLELLERHPRHRTAHAALLSHLIDMLKGSAPTALARRPQDLTEELSSSERRVLRYLPSNLSASEIAAELYVSTSTVKTHMRHIYDKLDAHRRTEAVERARALGLLGPSAPRRP